MTIVGLFSLLLAACADRVSGAYERGAAAFAAGDMRTARVELLNAVQADPANRAARLLRARVELALGDGAAAEAELGRARQAGAPAGDVAHLVAHARLLQGDPEGALREAAQAGPAHLVYAERMRARAAIALGRGEEAEAAFARARAAGPNDSLLWADIGAFRRGNGDVAGALEAADRAVAAGPGNAEALVLRGKLTRGQYGLAAAIPWFDRALEAEPDNVEALLERAATNADLGRMPAMLADTRRVRQLTGGHPRAFYLEAVLAARGGEYALARRLWDRTGGAYAGAPAGMLLLSAIDYQTGNEEQAARRLAALLERQPGNRRARRLLAAAQWRMGDAAATAATLRPLADRPDADAYALSLLGQALRRTGDRAGAAAYLARAARPGAVALTALDPFDDAAFADARRAAGARPGDGPAQLRLAAALLARGQTGEALARARRLQASNPGAPEAHILVGDALGAAGDHAGAAEQYRRAANLAFSEAVALRLIEALRRAGRSDEARTVLALFVRENPRSVAGLVLAAGQAMEDRDWPEAVRLYEGLRRRLGDNDATLLNNLAWAYSENGDLAAAVPLARRAWTLDRANPATADTLGWLLFRAGRRAEGLALLRGGVGGG